jgi:hypothetical protein
LGATKTAGTISFPSPLDHIVLSLYPTLELANDIKKKMEGVSLSKKQHKSTPDEFHVSHKPLSFPSAICQQVLSLLGSKKKRYVVLSLLKKNPNASLAKKQFLNAFLSSVTSQSNR